METIAIEIYNFDSYQLIRHTCTIFLGSIIVLHKGQFRIEEILYRSFIDMGHSNYPHSRNIYRSMFMLLIIALAHEFKISRKIIFKIFYFQNYLYLLFVFSIWNRVDSSILLFSNLISFKYSFIFF